MNTQRRPLILVLALLIGSSAIAAPSRTTRPSTRPATRPSTRAATGPSTRSPLADRQRLLELTRQSIELFKAKKLDEVEKVLTEALAIVPEHSTNLYNMACLKALKGKPAEAMDYLEKAAENGFTDFVHINRDTDLVSLHDLPRYKALVARKNEIQRKMADRVVESLKKQFGQKYLFEIDPDAKLIFATNTDPETLAALKKLLLAQAHSQWDQLFAHKPDQYIAVVLPSLEDYRKIVAMPGVGGFYNSANRVLISQRLGHVMVHEFTHALHDADNDAVGQAHPIWITEGLAVLWEASTFTGPKMVPHDNERLPYLQQAAKNKRLIPLEKLLKMAQPEFIRQATLAYGQSGSLMLYLYEKGMLRRFYETYKETFEKDKTGQAALEQVTGQKLPDLETAWRNWMTKRVPPPTNTGPNGAFVGIRFGQANDGLRVDELVKDGPADQAGIKPGDTITAINDTDVRDYATLMVLMSAHAPGEKITLKVRRDKEYLDLPVLLAKRPAPPPPATKPAPTSKPTTTPATRASKPPKPPIPASAT